jgi:hypothetical protein
MRELERGDIVQLKPTMKHYDKYRYGRALIDTKDEKGYAWAKGNIIHNCHVSILYDVDGAVLNSDEPIHAEMVTISKGECDLMIRIVNKHLGGF